MWTFRIHEAWISPEVAFLLLLSAILFAIAAIVSLVVAVWRWFNGNRLSKLHSVVSAAAAVIIAIVVAAAVFGPSLPETPNREVGGVDSLNAVLGVLVDGIFWIYFWLAVAASISVVGTLTIVMLIWLVFRRDRRQPVLERDETRRLSEQ